MCVPSQYQLSWTHPDKTTHGAIKGGAAKLTDHPETQTKRSIAYQLPSLRHKGVLNDRCFSDRVLDRFHHRAPVDQVFTTNIRNLCGESRTLDTDQNQRRRLASCHHRRQSSRSNFPRSDAQGVPAPEHLEKRIRVA